MKIGFFLIALFPTLLSAQLKLTKQHVTAFFKIGLSEDEGIYFCGSEAEFLERDTLILLRNGSTKNCNSSIHFEKYKRRQHELTYYTLKPSEGCWVNQSAIRIKKKRFRQHAVEWKISSKNGHFFLELRQGLPPFERPFSRQIIGLEKFKLILVSYEQDAQAN